MKILIDQLAVTNSEHIRTVEELAKEHEIVYWIRLEETVPLDKSRFPGTIFHNYHDARRGIAAPGIDTAAFEPWGRDAIASLASWETELMTMMDKGHSMWPVDQRKNFYYELLRYWGGVLDQLSPDLIIFNAPPHQVFNFVLYAIAKQRGIHTLIFDVAVRMDRIISFEDYRVGNERLAARTPTGENSVSVSLADVPAFLQENYRTVSGAKNPTPPALLEFKRETMPMRNLWRRAKSLRQHVKDGSIFERVTRRLSRLGKPRLKDIYRRLQKAPDFEKSYVYVPLNYQPECTTSPQGGVYVEQILAIQTLAAALPVGWELYVKEHPAQWPSHWGDFTPQRYPGYYEALARIPGVRIVPLETNTFELCDRARATATVSGTAGWESVLRGRCALVFGYTWFMHAPGIFRVGSVAECRAAFDRISAGETPDHGELLKYLAVLGEVIFPGTLSIGADRVKDADGVEQWRAMYDVITEHIRKIT